MLQCPQWTNLLSLSLQFWARMLEAMLSMDGIEGRYMYACPYGDINFFQSAQLMLVTFLGQIRFQKTENNPLKLKL